MEKIDIGAWDRKELFDFFSSVSDPFYMVTFRQDVTKLCRYAKARGLSFYYALVYLCTQAVNSVPAFQYTIRGDGVYRLERRIPSFTDLKKGSELFHIVTMPARVLSRPSVKLQGIEVQRRIVSSIQMRKETTSYTFPVCPGST